MVGLGDHGRGVRPAGGVCWREGGPGEFRGARDPPRDPAARSGPGRRNQLCDPARCRLQRARLPDAGPPAQLLTLPRLQAKAAPPPAGPVRNQRRARRLKTFCRLPTRLSNARAAAAAAAAPRFRLATRPAGLAPREDWRTKAIETRAVEDRTPLSRLRLVPFYAWFQSPRERTRPLPHSAPC